MTGGTGFLGAYIIRELINKGFAVRAIRRSPALPFFIDPEILQQVEWVEGDILDPVSLEAAMKGMDGVIHAAALISFGKGKREKMYRVNKEGTANVVNLALENQLKRLVYVSSVAALGRTASGEWVSEEKKWTETKQNTHYARSKHQAEMEVWRGIAEGLDAVIINPSTILGFGDWESGSSALFKKIYKGFRWYTKGINGFVDVEDVARATVLLLESDISDQRFLINGDNWSFEKLFSAIASGFHRKGPSVEASAFSSRLAWRLEAIQGFFAGKAPVLTRESARVALSKTRFDNTLVRETLKGFSFTPLEETIKRACEKYETAIKEKQLKL